MIRTHSCTTGVHTLNSHNIHYITLEMWSYLKLEIVQHPEKTLLLEASQMFY